MKRSVAITLALLFALATAFIFFRLGRQDILSDDGHYAFRAIGYFDFLNSLKQTTPVQWFGFRPFWSWLSFHDHPPLFFAIQHLFFKIFGVSVLVSRLPSALAGLGSAVAVFFLARRLGGIRAGLLALAALVLNSYFIWMSRIGLLESVFMFLLLLGLLFLVKSLDTGPEFLAPSRPFLASGLFFGLAFLTKYTLLFALPGIAVFLLWRHRWVFKNPNFWLGLIAFFIVILPVVVYNLDMYRSRGHFDVQFADLFNQPQSDWTNIRDRVGMAQFNPQSVLSILIAGFSWPYFLVLLAALVANFYLARKKPQFYLPLLIFFSFLIFFSIIGASSRWLGVFGPVAALIIGLSLDKFLNTSFYSRFRLPLAFAGGGLIVFLLFYAVNTNLLRKPLSNQIFYSDFRGENYGYNQLDKKITSMLSHSRVPADVQETVQGLWFSDLQPTALQFSTLNDGYGEQRSLIVFDFNTSWFATFWVFDKWRFYKRALIASSYELLEMNRSGIIKRLNPLRLQEIYFIKAGKAVREQAKVNFIQADELYESLEKNRVTPEIIYDDQGREAFYIYRQVLGPGNPF